MATLTITNDYYPNGGDEVIFVDATGGPVNITLPANHLLGKRYEIKDKMGVGSTTAITIYPQAPDTIDGQPSHQIIMDYQSIIVHSDGNNWYIL